MNINYTIHRYGEWIMLMLGESVLSLMIVDLSGSNDYVVTFYAGIISVILLEYLHFRSQPHDPDVSTTKTNRSYACTEQWFLPARLLKIDIF
jgi:hypothetical protein